MWVTAEGGSVIYYLSEKGLLQNLQQALFLVTRRRLWDRLHPYGMHSAPQGLSHGLKKCPPDTFLPRLRRGRPFESPPEIQKVKNPTPKGVGFFTW